MSSKETALGVPKIELPSDIRDALVSLLSRNEKVKVVGLGIFEKRDVPARAGRNPKTGATMQIPAYTKLKFRPTLAIKRAVGTVK